MKAHPASKQLNDRLIIGWNEWVQLPDLHIPAIKAKIDTGAKTSALHAFNIEKVKHGHQDIVQFCIHPLQGNVKTTLLCRAPLVDERYVMSSNGHKELRFVINTTLILGNLSWPIFVTLSNRDPLKFRMLIGRDALANHVFIDPHHCLYQGRITLGQLRKLYSNE